MPRKKVHDEYFRIPAYQILAGKSDDEMSRILGICKRTYKEKIKGYSDFTSTQGQVLSMVLKVSQDELFLTKNVSK